MATKNATHLQPFNVPELPYSYEALEPHIDAETMQIHHESLEEMYTGPLNEALANHSDLMETEIVPLMQMVGTAKLPDDVELAVRNHGGGHWNHVLYFMGMAPPGSNGDVGAPLEKAIKQGFGTLEEFKQQVTEVALHVFGEGYVWLVVDHDEGNKLKLMTTDKQDNPLMPAVVEGQATPIMGLDLWEHAYFLKYRIRRNEYLDAFWNVCNWDMLSENFQIATSHEFPDSAKMLPATLKAGIKGSKKRRGDE